MRGRLPPASSLGWPGDQQETLRALRERDAGIAGDHGGQPRARGRGARTPRRPYRWRPRRWCRAPSAPRRCGGARISDSRRVRAAGCAPIRPGRNSSDAVAAISLRRSAAYSFESSRAAGTCDEPRVAVVGIAIGVGQLERFHHRVDVVGGVPLHARAGRSLPECSAFRAARAPGSRSRACRPRSRGRWWRRALRARCGTRPCPRSAAGRWLARLKASMRRAISPR